jgi:hypothetical protein
MKYPQSSIERVKDLNGLVEQPKRLVRVTTIAARIDELIPDQRPFFPLVIFLPRLEKRGTLVLVDTAIYGTPKALQHSVSLFHGASQGQKPIMLRLKLLVARTTQD